jgi:hypothetical protein
LQKDSFLRRKTQTHRRKKENIDSRERRQEQHGMQGPRWESLTWIQEGSRLGQEEDSGKMQMLSGMIRTRQGDMGNKKDDFRKDRKEGRSKESSAREEA